MFHYNTCLMKQTKFPFAMPMAPCAGAALDMALEWRQRKRARRFGQVLAGEVAKCAAVCPGGHALAEAEHAVWRLVLMAHPMQHKQSKHRSGTLGLPSVPLY